MTGRGHCRYPYHSFSKTDCRCHERMGNDYWFLPAGRCLFDDEPISGSTWFWFWFWFERLRWRLLDWMRK